MTASRRTQLLKGQHLLAIAGISSAEIEALLELAGKYVVVNRQIKHSRITSPFLGRCDMRQSSRSSSRG